MKALGKYIRIAKRKPMVIPRALHGLFRTRFLGKRVLRGAEIAVTYQCPARCSKCSTKSIIETDRKEMSAKAIIAAAKQVSDAGGILIDLTGGEPLLREDIVSIVNELGKLPIIVSMATTGIPLRDEVLRALKEGGLDVLQFGLGSPVPAKHDQDTGVQGSFQKTVESIRRARELGMEVLINTVVTRELLYSEGIEEMAGLAQTYEAFLSLILPAQVGGWGKQDVRLTEEDYAALKPWFAKPFITTDTETSYCRGTCPAGTEKIYVTAYGDVYTCPFIQRTYGNIGEEDIHSIVQKMHRECRYTSCVNIKKSS